MSKIDWEWLEDEDQWIPYRKKDSKKIEAAFQKGDSEVSLSHPKGGKEGTGATYCINLLRLEQVNTATDFIRLVRRHAEIGDGEADEAWEYFEGTTKQWVPYGDGVSDFLTAVRKAGYKTTTCHVLGSGTLEFNLKDNSVNTDNGDFPIRRYSAKDGAPAESKEWEDSPGFDGGGGDDDSDEEWEFESAPPGGNGKSQSGQSSAKKSGKAKEADSKKMAAKPTTEPGSQKSKTEKKSADCVAEAQTKDMKKKEQKIQMEVKKNPSQTQDSEETQLIDDSQPAGLYFPTYGGKKKSKVSAVPNDSKEQKDGSVNPKAPKDNLKRKLSEANGQSPIAAEPSSCKKPKQAHSKVQAVPSLFAEVVAYLALTEAKANGLISLFKDSGGKSADELTTKVTHLIYENEKESRPKHLVAFALSEELGLPMIPLQWVEECLLSGSLLTSTGKATLADTNKAQDMEVESDIPVKKPNKQILPNAKTKDNHSKSPSEIIGSSALKKKAEKDANPKKDNNPSKDLPLKSINKASPSLKLKDAASKKTPPATVGMKEILKPEEQNEKPLQSNKESMIKKGQTSIGLSKKALPSKIPLLPASKIQDPPNLGGHYRTLDTVCYKALVEGKSFAHVEQVHLAEGFSDSDKTKDFRQWDLKQKCWESIKGQQLQCPPNQIILPFGKFCIKAKNSCAWLTWDQICERYCSRREASTDPRLFDVYEACKGFYDDNCFRIFSGHHLLCFKICKDDGSWLACFDDSHGP